jgi:hypothetical protein
MRDELRDLPGPFEAKESMSRLPRGGKKLSNDENQLPYSGLRKTQREILLSMRRFPLRSIKAFG